MFIFSECRSTKDPMQIDSWFGDSADFDFAVESILRWDYLFGSKFNQNLKHVSSCFSNSCVGRACNRSVEIGRRRLRLFDGVNASWMRQCLCPGRFTTLNLTTKVQKLNWDRRQAQKAKNWRNCIWELLVWNWRTKHFESRISTDYWCLSELVCIHITQL